MCDPEAMFAEEVFADLSIPHRRIQALGANAIFHLREDEHSFRGGPGRGARPDISRLLIQFEER